MLKETMCGRYVFNPDNSFQERFQLSDKTENLIPNFNVSPGNVMPVVLKNDTNHLQMMTWGYVPEWAKNEIKIKLINTRADSLLTKPSFKKAFENQRCLVPATGFYEWQKSTKKIPFYFSLKDQSIFSFAGIYNKNTYSIITTEANDLVNPIHNRMPVILSPENESIWLSKNDYDISSLISLLKPYSSSKLQTYPVSSEVNYTSKNSPDLIKPS